jgi:hypothetical protein
VSGRGAGQQADTRGAEVPATGSPSQRFHVVRISLFNLFFSFSSLALLTLKFPLLLRNQPHVYGTQTLCEPSTLSQIDTLYRYLEAAVVSR